MAPPYSDQPSLDEKLPDPPDPTFSRTDTSHSRSNKRGLARIDQKGHEQVSHKAPRVTTVYMSMFLEQSFTIEKNAFYPICAAGATWVLLAGFIVLPGTYTKFQNSEIIKAAQEDKSNFGNQILAGVAGLKILAVAIYLCGIGLVGIIALWVRWRKNYIWLINKVLL